MPRSEIIERERRWARPAAIAAMAVIVLFIAGVAIAAGVEAGDPDSEADQLRAFDEGYGTLLLSAAMSALSLALMAPVLIYLFKAAEARSDRVRSAMLGLVVAGPIFFAVSVILQIVAVGTVADDFVAGNSDCAADDDECIDDLVTGESLYGVAGGLVLAGRLGLGIGLLYACLWAMRTGLLTRFMGTLGMAVGAATVIFGPAFATIYLLGLGFVIMGWVPGGRPQAWDRGEAVPWPKPGEQVAAGPDPDEPVEGRADEIFPDAKPPPGEQAEAEEDRPEPGSIADEVERASRSAEAEEGAGPQKRKRRG